MKVGDGDGGKSNSAYQILSIARYVLTMLQNLQR